MRDRFLRPAMVIVCLLGGGILAPCAGAEELSFPLIQCLELEATARSVTLSPDGCYFLVTVETSGRENVVRVDAGTWVTTQLPIDISPCYPLCLNPDGTLLVCGWGREAHVIDTATFQERLVLPGRPRAYSFSPDGALLASIDQTNRLTIWDTSTWKEVRGFQVPCSHGRVSTLAFALGGDALVTFSDSQIIVWAVASREVIRRLEYSGPASLTQLMPDGREVAFYGHDGTLHVLDLGDGREVGLLPASDPLPLRFGFTPNARFIATIDGTGADISIFSLLSGALVAALEGDPVEVRAVAVCAAGNFAVSVGRTGRVCVWDISALGSYRGSSFEIARVDWQSGSITITNRASAPLDLLGWTISDGEKSYTFRSSLRVAGGQSIIIYPTTRGPGKSAYGLQVDGTDEQVSLYAPEVCGGELESTKRQ